VVGELSRCRLRDAHELASSFNRMLWALRAFSTYVPMKLANQVVQGVVGAQVASEERELTVMFTDIVSFTSLSEGMNAVEVADFINDHLTMLAQCVEETGGTIDKYIGDALMAFWGAPQRMENTSAAACRAAALMAQRLREDNLQRLAAGKQPIRLRIGIHTGPLVVGNIGAPGRINYTVVGDTVNVAQRLESLGKQVDADAEFVALLSSATADHLADEFTLHAEGEFQLRGKQHDVGVLRLQV
jgi:adenylate cyclase